MPVLKQKLVLGMALQRKGFEKYPPKIDNFDWKLKMFIEIKQLAL